LIYEKAHVTRNSFTIKSKLFNCAPDKFDGVCWRTWFCLLRTASWYHANVFSMLALNQLAFANWKLVIATSFFCF